MSTGRVKEKAERPHAPVRVRMYLIVKRSCFTAPSRWLTGEAGGDPALYLAQRRHHPLRLGVEQTKYYIRAIHFHIISEA